MEFYEVIDNRHSIRQFEDREIPRDILARILNAGLKAPSSNHQRRWELVTLTDKAIIHDLAQIVRPYAVSRNPRRPNRRCSRLPIPASAV